MNGPALIAANLRRLRLLRGFSQERLAHDADVERSYVWKLESARENPTVEVLEKLTATLGVPLKALFEEVDPHAVDPPPLRRGRRPSR